MSKCIPSGIVTPWIIVSLLFSIILRNFVYHSAKASESPKLWEDYSRQWKQAFSVLKVQILPKLCLWSFYLSYILKLVDVGNFVTNFFAFLHLFSIILQLPLLAQKQNFSTNSFIHVGALTSRALPFQLILLPLLPSLVFRTIIICVSL